MASNFQLPFNPQDFQNFAQQYQSQPGAVNPATASTPQQRQEAALKQAQAFMSYLQTKNQGQGQGQPWQPSGQPGSFQPQGQTSSFPPQGQHVSFQPQGQYGSYPPQGQFGSYPPQGQTGSYPPQQFSRQQPGTHPSSTPQGQSAKQAYQQINLEAQQEEQPTPSCNPFSGGHSHKHGGQGHTHGSGCNHDHGSGGHDHGHSHGGQDHGHSHGGHNHGNQGHSHSHDPEKGPAQSGGHSHGHSHGKKGGFKQVANKYGRGIQFFTCLMPFNGWALCFFAFAPVIEDDFERFMVRFFPSVLVVLCFITYYYACTINQFLRPRKVSAYAGPQNQKTCEPCGGHWKPERTHHCKTCGKCVPKMDHHCPWIVGCVGHRNHKAFLLFCIYLTTAGSYFLYRSYVFAKFMYYANPPLDYSVLFYLYWIPVSVIIFPFIMMGVGLSLFHSLFAMNNSTTLESMGGRGLKFPCVPDNPKGFQSIWHKGFIPNLADFLHNRMLLWWWPTEPEVSSDGTIFETIPMVSHAELEIRSKSIGITVVGDGAIESTLKPRVVDFQAMLKEAEDLTNQKNLKHDVMMLEFGKRKDKFCTIPNAEITTAVNAKK